MVNASWIRRSICDLYARLRDMENEINQGNQISPAKARKVTVLDANALPFVPAQSCDVFGRVPHKIYIFDALFGPCPASVSPETGVSLSPHDDCHRSERGSDHSANNDCRCCKSEGGVGAVVSPASMLCAVLCPAATNALPPPRRGLREPCKAPTLGPCPASVFPKTGVDSSPHDDRHCSKRGSDLSATNDCKCCESEGVVGPALSCASGLSTVMCSVAANALPPLRRELRESCRAPTLSTPSTPSETCIAIDALIADLAERTAVILAEEEHQAKQRTAANDLLRKGGQEKEHVAMLIAATRGASEKVAAARAALEERMAYVTGVILAATDEHQAEVKKPAASRGKRRLGGVLDAHVWDPRLAKMVIAAGGAEAFINQQLTFLARRKERAEAKRAMKTK